MQTAWPEADGRPGGGGPPPPVRRRRTRQVIGVIITVAVLVVAYGSQYFPIGRSPGLALRPAPPTGCAASLYPGGAQYRFEQCWQGQPVTWQRCTTLTVVVDPSDAPPGWAGDLSYALTQLGQATGLRFQTASHGSGPVTLAWSPTLLGPVGSESDKAGVTHVQSRFNNAGAEIASASIQISTRLIGGTGPNGEVPVLLHEFGHAVGLAHYVGPEVMNPVDQGFASYQNGDLAGLAALYPRGACS